MNTDAYTRTALSVSELNREAKVLLEGHFDRVTVEGRSVTLRRRVPDTGIFR